MAYLVIVPGEVLDYTCDWSSFLEETGSPSDAITSSSWDVVPGGSPGLEVQSNTFTSATTTAFVAGGVVREIYELVNTIVTSIGRTGKRSITLICAPR